MFQTKIWRVCVAPTHPLAGHLYDQSLLLTKKHAVPYLNLYSMKQRDDADWDLQGYKGQLPDNKAQPFSQLFLNGMLFDTVHDPEFFLTKMYGDDYTTPKPRE